MSWFSSTEKCVMPSTSQAEYVALADHNEESAVSEAGLAFHVTWRQHAVHTGVGFWIEDFICILEVSWLFMVSIQEYTKQDSTTYCTR